MGQNRGNKKKKQARDLHDQVNRAKRQSQISQDPFAYEVDNHILDANLLETLG